jgi:hypothetical protein
MKLLVQPESSSYSLSFAEDALRVELDGGRGRYRLDILNASKKIRGTFILDEDDYDYFMAFYRRQARYGAEPFTMDLIVDSSEQAECTVHIIPGSLSLDAQSGLAYTVSCELEVESPYNPDQDTEDDAVIAAYNTAQGYSPP